MSQTGLKLDKEGKWVSYNISDSNDTGWNDSIINAKLEKNVDKGAKRAIFTGDTVTNEIEIDPYKGAYDDYIPWWLQKGNGGNDIDDTGDEKTTRTPSPYEEVFGKPSLGAQTYNLTGKSIQELYAEKELPGKTIGQHLSKGLTLGAASVISEKWKDRSLETEIRRREESNILLHGTKIPTVEETWGKDDIDTGAKPTGLSTATYAGDKGPMERGKGGVLTRKTKQAEEPSGGLGRDYEEEQAQYTPSTTSPGHPSQQNGGANDGGKSIICTQMYQHTQLEDWKKTMQLWYIFQKKYLTIEHQKGYHFLFKPFVNGMKKSKILTTIGKYCAIARTNDIKYIMFRTPFSLSGRLVRLVTEPICYIIGKIKSWL